MKKKHIGKKSDNNIKKIAIRLAFLKEKKKIKKSRLKKAKLQSFMKNNRITALR